jgi:hypothetical protein
VWQARDLGIWGIGERRGNGKRKGREGEPARNPQVF